MERIEFTKEMKQDYTILIPNMLPIHFSLIVNVFRQHGYKAEVLEKGFHLSVPPFGFSDFSIHHSAFLTQDEGLLFVDTYPSIGL